MNNKILIGLSALTLMLSSPLALSHDSGFENNSCNIELNNDVTITPDHILIRSGNETIYDIYKDNMVFYKGERVSLSAEQEALISDYAYSTRSLVPKINDIVVGSIQVASDALSKTFTELGVDNDIEAKFSELQYTLQQEYSRADGTYHFSSNDLDVDFANKQIDQAVEDIMEELVPSLVGNVLQLVGKAMTEGEGSLEHLDGLDERIEAQIEEQAELLEEKVEYLCDEVERLNDIEDQIADTSSKFNQFDTVIYNTK